MLQAIVFDFDGIIVDSEPLHYRAFLKVVEPLGVHFDYARYITDYIGYDDRDFFRVVARDFNLPFDAAKLPDFVLAKAKAFADICAEGVRPLPGAVELILAAGAVMPIALCSGALQHDIDLILPALDRGQVPKLFRAVVTADQVKRSKPDPESYGLAVRKLGLPPAACLAIEDTPAGLTSAKGAGLRTLGVAGSLAASQLSLADRVVPSLAGVTVEQLHAWFD